MARIPDETALRMLVSTEEIEGCLVAHTEIEVVTRLICSSRDTKKTDSDKVFIGCQSSLTNSAYSAYKPKQAIHRH